MKIELLYTEGVTYTVYIPEKAFANVAACLMDDVSVTVARHQAEKTEEEAK